MAKEKGSGKRQHLFISHHHRDDAEVEGLTNLLNRAGWDVRNSSIRAKPSNQARLDRNEIPERTLKRLLRMKISWASRVVVLIGKQTHERPWVNWEIEKAHALGKQIVGVYARGATEADVPSALKKYGTSIVGWNSERIMDAIEGRLHVFEGPDGGDRPPVRNRSRPEC